MPNRPAPNVRKPDVAIIGAGVIGLAIAWRLAAQGASVQVVDRGAAGAGASHAAAGMLAACAEAEPGEEALVALGRESQARWPAFAAELLKASGIDVDLRGEGTLVVALTADDQARLSHQLVFQQKLGLPLQWISAAETRRREPHLAGKLAGAVFSPEDTQVDNRKLAAALRLAAEAAGARVSEHRAVSTLSSRGRRVDGIVLADGTKVAADVVVLAAGAWSRSIAGLGPELLPPVRPIKGQMLALRMDPAAPLLNHVVWAPAAYLVPRRDGRLLVGATVEEKGYDTSLTAGGMLTLLEAAWRAVPRSRSCQSMRCGWAIDRAAATMRRSSAPGPSTGSSTPPVTIATEFCLRRSLPTPSHTSCSTASPRPRFVPSASSALGRFPPRRNKEKPQ